MVETTATIINNNSSQKHVTFDDDNSNSIDADSQKLVLVPDSSPSAPTFPGLNEQASEYKFNNNNPSAAAADSNLQNRFTSNSSEKAREEGEYQQSKPIMVDMMEEEEVCVPVIRFEEQKPSTNTVSEEVANGSSQPTQPTQPTSQPPGMSMMIHDATLPAYTPFDADSWSKTIAEHQTRTIQNFHSQSLDSLNAELQYIFSEYLTQQYEQIEETLKSGHGRILLQERAQERMQTQIVSFVNAVKSAFQILDGPENN
ncbi:hypothetical protein BGZ49_001761 [Haplosporangium sp. Z 27]|nr:hypothetical protein BGZ49_001761 [Haplosporangium sp. Z 27]